MARAAVNREALDPGSNDGPLLAVMDEAVALEEEAARGLGPFRSLRYRDYRLLWIGTLLGSAGQWIQQATVPWLAYDMTGSGFLLGAVNAGRSGASLGGFLLLHFGAGENFFLQSIAYVGVATMVLLMVVPRLPRASAVSVRENLVEGAQYVWRHPMLRAQMMLGLVPMVVGIPYMTLLPIFAKDVLHANAGS